MVLKIINKPVFQLVFIIFCAILFNILPYLISGVPLQDQVLSDVEAHISTWQLSLYPSIFSKDTILRSGLDALPSGQLMFNYSLGVIAKSLNIDLFTFSVFLSFCSLILFLCGLYLLLLFSLKEKYLAFLISLAIIIPVHALGSLTLGFQALGFLPRDLAAAVTIFILLLYFRAIEQESNKKTALVFLVTGIFANFYPAAFFQLVIMLFLTECIRTRRLNVSYIGYGGLFLLGALPTLFDIALKSSLASPIDIEIMRSYYKYMMVSLTWESITHYLRRFVIYVLLAPSIYFLFIWKASESDRRRLHTWVSLAISSFFIAIVGVYMESATLLGKYMMSRTSVWFILSAMVIVAYGLHIFFRRYPGRKAFILTTITISTIFVFQSNLPTTYRFLRNTYNDRAQKKDFHLAISKLKQMTREDDVILAPSDEYYDLAASVRTYSLRPIFVCYKYGGISIMDGTIGREWWKRYQQIKLIFSERKSKSLIDFMQRENIHYAFIPANYYPKNDPYLQGHIATYTEHFLIIKI